MIFLFFWWFMKKVILFMIILLCLFLIYNQFNTKKLNFMILGERIDSLENLKSTKRIMNINNYFKNLTVNGLTKDIKNNRTIRINAKDLYLKKELRESDILLINIGESELAKEFSQYDVKTNQKILNKLYEDFAILIKEIRLYAKEKIIFVGFYNPTNYYDGNMDYLFYQLNSKLNKLMQENKIIYLDLYNEVKSNKYKDENSYCLNINGRKMLVNLIKKYLN